MKRTGWLGLVAATVVTITAASMAPPVHATASEVGGGAAGIHVDVFVNTPGTNMRGVFAHTSSPSVVLPPQGGGPFTTSATAPVDGFVEIHLPEPVEALIDIPVSADHVRVRTVGNLSGTPYAESSATAENVLVARSRIKVLETYCRWDTSGVTATTSFTNLNGQTVEPKPNTEVLIPRVGRAVLNHQVTETLPSGAQVIHVSALHLEFGDVLDRVGGGVVTVDIALSSCDPNKIPLATGAGIVSRVGSSDQ